LNVPKHRFGCIYHQLMEEIGSFKRYTGGNGEIVTEVEV